MRLIALEVNVSIWLSEKGWTTSDSRNTFFLPLAPAVLEQIESTQLRIHSRQHSDSCLRRLDSLGLCRRKDGFR